MPPVLKRIRLLSLFAALAMASLWTAASASATNTFTFFNLEGNTLTGYPPNWPAACFGSGWGSWTGQGNLPPLQSASGTVVVDSSDPPCNGAAGITIQGRASGFSGTWTFRPYAPAGGEPSIAQCNAQGLPYERFAIDQSALTCYASLAPRTPDVNFVASTAGVRRGAAFVPVQMYAKTGVPGYPFRGRVAVALRTRAGSLVGRGEEVVGVGNPRVVKVPVDRSVRRRIQKRKSHQVTVRATVRRIDHIHGTGDRITMILQPDRPSLPF
jgi:hypothetical protein